jgi:hypothetical protein
MQMKKFFWLMMFAAFFTACKKGFDAEPTYAKATIAGTWAKTEPFYSPTAERFDEPANRWRSFIAFTVTSEGEPDKIGFANPYVPGKGTNALAMNTIYTAQSISSDSGYYNITIPKCFQFIPEPGNVTRGKVIVLPQEVRIWRRDKTFFIIKISPGSVPGTYDTNTKTFEVEVSFDETSIGGPANVKRKYRFAA